MQRRDFVLLSKPRYCTPVRGPKNRLALFNRSDAEDSFIPS